MLISWRLLNISYWSGGNVSLLSISRTLELLLLSDCFSRSLCSLSRCCFSCCWALECGETPFVCGTIGWLNLFFGISWWWWFVMEISSRDLFDKWSCSSLSSDSEISSELMLERRKPWLSTLTLAGCITFGLGVVMMIPRPMILGSQEIFIQLRYSITSSVTRMIRPNMLWRLQSFR